MDSSKWGVHASHCCILHGCKYGDSDCPVINKQIEQLYICEYCDDDGIKSIEELLIKKEKRSMDNFFKNTNDKELIEVYKDYLGSKELGILCNSFKGYGLILKEKYFTDIPCSLGDCITIIQRMFFEEVAYRFFRIE